MNDKFWGINPGIAKPKTHVWRGGKFGAGYYLSDCGRIHLKEQLVELSVGFDKCKICERKNQ